MTQVSPPHTPAPAWLAPLLAWVAGGVDAIGYLTLGQVFTAHMSGNSAAFAAHLGHGDWGDVLHRALPIPLFVAGVALGAYWIEVAVRVRARSPCGGVLRLEAVLLVLFGVCLALAHHQPRLGWTTDALTVLPTVAMGLQNAALRRAGCVPVRTTFVSGMLTNLAAGAVEALAGPAPHDARGRRTRAWARLRLYGGIWCAFVAGAAMGSAAELARPAPAVLLPLIGLSGLLAYDLRHPIPVGDSMLPELAPGEAHP